MAVSTQVHYASVGIVDRILAAIPYSPDDGVKLAPTQLFPFDQLHGRELLATREHTARLNAAAGQHVLDIGSGIGGPARYIASTYGSNVTGVDLTADFVAASKTLSKLCGLDHLVQFDHADATHLPYSDGKFDSAVCFYVGMNLPQKREVLGEAFRVLKPGGRLIWTEAVSQGTAPHYPLPWAREPGGSHLSPREELEGLFKAVGFNIIAAEDETSAHLELARQRQQAGTAPPAGHLQANEVVLGANFAVRRKNYIRSLADNHIASLLIEAAKP